MFALTARALTSTLALRSYASIPQADPEAQGRAIASLVNYVNASAYFMCLAGPWTHEHFGTPRDDLAWSGRGWVRVATATRAWRSVCPSLDSRAGFVSPAVCSHKESAHPRLVPPRSAAWS